MNKRLTIFSILFLISTILFGQFPIYFDSISFFKRNKIKIVLIKETINDTIHSNSKISIDTKKLTRTFCIKYNKKNSIMMAIPHGKWQCDPSEIFEIINKDTLLSDFTAISEFTFDSQKRVNKITAFLSPGDNTELYIKKYYYVDSLSKRLKLITLEHYNYVFVDSTIIEYKDNKINKVIQSTYTDNKRIKSEILYSYYNDGKVKSTNSIYDNYTFKTEYLYKIIDK